MATELTDKELDLIVRTVLGEAGGEGKKGMEAVAHVIRNRALSGRYPSNPAAVAVQGNGTFHQFSTWNPKEHGGNNPLRFKKDSREYREALDIVQRVMAGEVEDPTAGATHFYVKGSSVPYWFDEESPAGSVEIGNHVFGARSASALQAIEKAVPRPTAAQAANALALAPVPASRSAVIRAQQQTGVAPQPATLPPGLRDELRTRIVQTVPVGPDGRPQSVIQQAAEREAARLRQLRQNANDRIGPAALTVESNAASADKEPRLRDQVGEAALAVASNAASANKQARLTPPDLVGDAARQTPGNAAASQKQSRALTPEQQALQAAVEREAARRAALLASSPERQIQQAREEQRVQRTVPRQVGVQRVQQTFYGDRPQQLAGTVQLPRDVRPRVDPSPFSQSRNPLGQMPSVADLNTFRTNIRYVAPPPAPPADEWQRLNENTRFTTVPQGPQGRRPSPDISDPSPKGPRGRGGRRGLGADITEPAPTIEEIATVTRAKPVVVRRPPPGPTPAQRQQQRARVAQQQYTVAQTIAAAAAEREAELRRLRQRDYEIDSSFNRVNTGISGEGRYGGGLSLTS